MASGRRRVWLTVLTIAIVVLVAMWLVGYHRFELKGAVGLRDSGFFSYPRYHVQLGSVPLWQAGQYEFKVSGLPPGPLDLRLQVSDQTGANSDELTALSTNVAVSMTESSGKQVCEGAGSLSDARMRERSTWALASSSSQASFWHSRCLQVSTNRFKSYVVRVKISDVAPRSPHVSMLPILEGGGIELP
jgi:hypothetical protein